MSRCAVSEVALQLAVEVAPHIIRVAISVVAVLYWHYMRVNLLCE